MKKFARRECLALLLALGFSGCAHNREFGLLEAVENLSNSNASVRAAAKTVIRQSGTNAIPLFLEMVKDDQQGPVAVEGFEVLGSIGHPAIPALEEMLTNSHPSPLVAASLASVGSLGIDVLLRHIRAGNPRLRAVAALGLGGLGDQNAGVIMALIGCLKDPAPVVRTSAANSLGSLGFSAEIVVPALAATAIYDTNLNTRFAALQAIGAYGSAAQPSIPQISKLAEDPEYLIREATRTAISRISR